MKGQISLELLIIFSVFLVVLSFSLYTLTEMNKRNTEAYNSMRLKLMFEDIADAVENICILGDGNIRRIELPVEVTVEFQDSVMTLHSSGKEYERYVPCIIKQKNINGTILIKNSRGIIIFEKV